MEEKSAKIIDAIRDNVDTPCTFPRTPAMYAASKGCAACLALFIDSGCKVNAADIDAKTATIWASAEGNDECLALHRLPPISKQGCRIRGRTHGQSTDGK